MLNGLTASPLRFAQYGDGPTLATRWGPQPSARQTRDNPSPLPLPTICHTPSTAMAQPQGTLERKTTSRHPSALLTSVVNTKLEGDLVTGTVDAAHERAHMIPAIRDASRADVKKEIVRINSPLTDDPIHSFAFTRRRTSDP